MPRTGRPKKTTGALGNDIKVRVDDATLLELDKYCEAVLKNRAEAIRSALAEMLAVPYEHEIGLELSAEELKPPKPAPPEPPEPEPAPAPLPLTQQSKTSNVQDLINLIKTKDSFATTPRILLSELSAFANSFASKLNEFTSGEYISVYPQFTQEDEQQFSSVMGFMKSSIDKLHNYQKECHK